MIGDARWKRCGAAQGAVLAGVGAATAPAGGAAAARSAGGRLGLAGAAGMCLGGYLALDFFPGEPPLQARP
jgi:hypothetical protein